MDGFPTNQDLAPWSNDQFRGTDNSGVIGPEDGVRVCQKKNCTCRFNSESISNQKLVGFNCVGIAKNLALTAHRNY